MPTARLTILCMTNHSLDSIDKRVAKLFTRIQPKVNHLIRSNNHSDRSRSTVKYAAGQNIRGLDGHQIRAGNAGAARGEQAIGLPQASAVESITHRARIRKLRLCHPQLDVAQEY